MKYKGYTGVVEFDEESGTLFGRVIGLRDLITFEGDSVAEVIQAFHDSVDVYVELCTERGESPEKPFSGQFVLRIDPKLHRALSHAAEERSKSLNALVEETLAAAVLPPKGSHGQHVLPEAVHGREIPPRGSRGREVPPETVSGRGPGEPVRPGRKRARGA